jgi:hypothetical protein
MIGATRYDFRDLRAVLTPRFRETLINVLDVGARAGAGARDPALCPHALYADLQAIAQSLTDERERLVDRMVKIDQEIHLLTVQRKLNPPSRRRRLPLVDRTCRPATRG